MAGQRTVLLDPDGTGPEWMYVVIEFRTGVVYEQQYGGTACRQGQAEGYLVPVDGTTARPALDDVFVRGLKGVGAWHRGLDDDHLGAVRNAVATIRYWPQAQGSVNVEHLRLDESRLDELDEGWIPVQTSDGTGVLIWPNSD